MFGRAAGGVALYDKQFVVFGFFARATAQLAHQIEVVFQAVFGAGDLLFFAGRLAHLGRQKGFFQDDLGQPLFVLFEKLAKRLVDDILYGNTRFGVAELGLCLPLELHVLHFYGQHRRKPLAVIVAQKVGVFVFEHARLARQIVHHFGERGLKTRFVRAALRGGNVVHIRKNIFGVRVRILERQLHFYIVFGARQKDRLLERGHFGFVEILYKVVQSALVAVFAL